MPDINSLKNYKYIYFFRFTDYQVYCVHQEKQKCVLITRGQLCRDVLCSNSKTFCCSTAGFTKIFQICFLKLFYRWYDCRCENDIFLWDPLIDYYFQAENLFQLVCAFLIRPNVNIPCINYIAHCFQCLNVDAKIISGQTWSTNRQRTIMGVTRVYWFQTNK